MALISFRPLARILIPDLVREGRGITNIVNELKSLGMGYHNQTMFQDVHAFKGFMDKEYLFTDFDTSLSPTRDMLVETPLRRVKNYRAYGEARTYNTETASYETRTVSMYYDNEMSFDELEQMFMEEKEKEEYKPEEIVEGITFKGVEHNEGFEY